MHRVIMQPRQGPDRPPPRWRRPEQPARQSPRLHAATTSGLPRPRWETGGSSASIWFKNRWVARIQYHGKTYHLGSFVDEIEAAKARDRKAYELFGEMAYLNFPEDLPALRRLCRKKRPPRQKSAKKRRS